MVYNAHLAANIPMVISTNTVAPTVPNTQNKPRRVGEEYAIQIPFSGTFPYPPKEVKEHKSCMEYKEENIEEGEHEWVTQ